MFLFPAPLGSAWKKLHHFFSLIAQREKVFDFYAFWRFAAFIFAKIAAEINGNLMFIPVLQVIIIQID